MTDRPPIGQWLAIALATAGACGSAHAVVNLPASAALPLASASNPGFTVVTAQASTNVVVANNYIRALRQVQGRLTDAAGNPVSNVAVAGTGAGGAYYSDVVAFEKDAVIVGPVDLTGTIGTYMVSDYFPGIPGQEGATTQFAVEAVALVALDAGFHSLAISANADRTDVNDDDNYAVYVGANPRDYFTTKIAEFNRGGAQGFTKNQYVENLIEVVAPVSGVYPFRILYWQQGAGANLHFYQVDTNTTERLLINDVNDNRAPRSYRSSTVAAFNSTYVSEVSPVPASAGNSSSAPIEVILNDGTGASVNLATIQLQLNGVTVTPQVKTKVGTQTTVRFSPDSGRSNPNNDVRLTYTDSLGASVTKQWAFTIITAGGSSTRVAGQWDFNQGNLNATVGQPLAYVDPSYDGPSGSAADKTQFGTCSSLGAPLINGQDAVVMRVPGGLDRRYGFLMNHGISPNGGGTKVNQFTLIMDVLVENTGAFAASLLQIDTPNNTSDGDLFWQQGNFGQGGGGYNGYGTFSAGSWHRVVAAYDMAANPPVVTKFVDGIKQDDWTANQGLDAARRALQPTAVLFGDGDQDERRTMWVNSIQIREGKLSDAEMVALGGAEAAGIPSSLPQSTVTGQWDFDGGDLRASLGKPLAYLDPAFDGPAGSAASKTEFGTCSGLGVALINGADANVMKVPGDLDRRIGYVMTHGIAPNGGGTKVNQFTLVMDVLVENTGAFAASLLQVDTTNNTSDGDLFWQQGNFGQGGGGYNGYGTFSAGSWHRVCAAYDMAANPPVVTKYVDGIKQDDWTANQALDAARRALQPTAVLFGDGDQDERRTMWVNSIQIRAGKLSDAEMVYLGGPSASGIPVFLPKSNIAGQWDFNDGDLRATIGNALTYIDPTWDGPTGSSANLSTFDTVSNFGLPALAGGDAKVVKIPGDLDRRYGYVMKHGISPNGGGTKVNQYTLIMDIYVENSGAFAASLLQVDTPDNTSDGDLFWQQGNFGQGGGGYNGPGTFTAGAWHRIAASYNMAANPPVVTKYVDGIFQDDWTANQALDAARRALLPTAVLFGDGDQDERRTMYVNSIQIRSGALSKAELASLGTPTASGIPLVLTVSAPPVVSVGKLGNQLVFSWAQSATGYTLESTSNLVSGPWTAVPGVVNNSKTVTVGSGMQFFRLRK